MNVAYQSGLCSSHCNIRKYSFHWNVGLCLSHCDNGFCTLHCEKTLYSSHCDIWKCLAHCVMTGLGSLHCDDNAMFFRLQRPYMFVTFWHYYVYHLTTSIFVHHTAMKGLCSSHCDVCICLSHCDITTLAMKCHNVMKLWHKYMCIT